MAFFLWFYPFYRTVQYQIVWKLLKMSHLNILILAISTNFWHIKTDLSGNTLLPKASDFWKTRQNWSFSALFNELFVHAISKRSSLRSQCWMRLILLFSNTVHWGNMGGLLNKPQNFEKSSSFLISFQMYVNLFWG